MNPIKGAVLELLSSGPRAAPELAHSLNASPSTVLRAVRSLECEQRVVRIGKTRGARYAMRRNIVTIGSQWPIYRINERGEVHELGNLEAIERNSYYVTAGPPRVQGLFEGMPYFLQDARPAGFLGRAVPSLYPELELPPRVVDWTDDHFLTYLTRRDTDAIGSFIVGTESMDRHLSGSHAAPVVPASQRAKQYPTYALQAMAGSPPGSSVQGEHPKFTAWVGTQQRRVAVIVKFSPPRSTAIGRRWADLLTAEHVAHRVLSEHGIRACSSELLEYDDRVFLQCERFDRVGPEGRRSVVSLYAFDMCRYGRLDSWTAAAERLTSDGLLPTEDSDRIRLLDAFGALIANTDRHFGNITLFDDYQGPFALAPVYDMLPMLFAPQSDQIVPREFAPPPPRSAWLPVWARARSLAETYWDTLLVEPGLSEEFRQLCAHSVRMLRATPSRGMVAS
jgi:hypothetical protein